MNCPICNLELINHYVSPEDLVCVNDEKDHHYTLRVSKNIERIRLKLKDKNFIIRLGDNYTSINPGSLNLDCKISFKDKEDLINKIQRYMTLA